MIKLLQMFKSLQITSKQLLVAAAIAVITILLTFIPIIYGSTSVSDDSYFTGKTMSSKYDLYTYLSWIEQGREGKILFQQLYSTENQPQIFFHPIFLITGRTADLLQVSNLTAYYILRAFSAVVFFISAFLLVSFFLRNTYERFLAFALVCSSAGLGFVLTAGNKLLWLYEFNSFSDAAGSVLDMLGLSLVFGIFLVTLQKFKKRNWLYLLLAGVMINLLALIHTYDLALLFSILFSYALWQLFREEEKFTFLNSCYLLLLTLPSVLWQVYVLYSNSPLGVWAFLQSQVATSPFYVILIQYGLLALFGLIGFYISVDHKRKEYTFLVIWLLIGFLLVYTPLFANFQRKFGIGYHVLLCIFSAVAIQYGFSKLISNAGKFVKYGITGFVVVFLSLTNVYTTLVQMSLYDGNPRPYYITRNEYNSLVWLRENVQKPATVLTDYELANVVPGITGLSVFVGHYDQTISADAKFAIGNNMVTNLVQFKDPLRGFVKQEGINYVVIGQETKSLGNFRGENREYLKLVYRNSDVEIYQVQ